MIENRNQKLITAENRVKSLEQKIEFRAKGKHGIYLNELAKAKKIRDDLLFSITNGNTETEELIQYALKVKEDLDVLTKETDEFKKRMNKLSLFADYLENGIPKWNGKHTPKPNFDNIGKRRREENQKALEKAQKDFDSALYKSENAPKMYSGKYASELQQTRNTLNSILKDVELQEGIIEFYKLRAERDWLETIIKELEDELAFNQTEITKAEMVLGIS
jgi:hypothetical protein